MATKSKSRTKTTKANQRAKSAVRGGRRDLGVDAARTYSTDSLMAAMGIGRESLRGAVVDGWLHPVRVGRRLVFSGSEVVEWIDRAARGLGPARPPMDLGDDNFANSKSNGDTRDDD